MKSTLFRTFPLVALIFGFALGGVAYASNENETKFTGVVESLPKRRGFLAIGESAAVAST